MASTDLLTGLLAPYASGGGTMDTTSPLLSLALSVAMGQMGASAAPASSPSGAGSGSGGGFSGPVPTGGNLQSWIDQAEKITGTSNVPNVDQMLRILIQHESGGNPSIVNSTPTPRGFHAEGLAQMIPPTFQTYAIPGLGGIDNPVANLSAAIKYMVDRYGSIAATPGIHSVLQGGPYAPY